MATSSKLQLSNSRVLTGFPGLTEADSPPAGVTTLPELFQYQARSQPLAPAFSCTTDQGLVTVTYADADRKARALARQLRRLHGGASSNRAPVVAIWLEKGLDLNLSILAVTYSGATWLPFDPDVPEDRAAACIVDSGASVLLCDAQHSGRADVVQGKVEGATEASLQITTVDALSQQATTADQKPSSQESDDDTYSNAQPSDAAYLIYTSGTTGTPKGIAIPQSAALLFSLSECAVLQTSPKDIVWNGFSPAFDMFVEEMWVTVAGGGHLAIGTRDECRDVPSLPAIWEKRGVTIVNAVPTLIGIMGIAQSGGAGSKISLPQSVRLINLGGEACPPSLVTKLARPGLRLINTYGPSETTVTATWDELQPEETVTIGRPLPSYHACLLSIPEDGANASSQPMDIVPGVEGELAIGGPCVGLGYVGREELTAQKFLKHPLAAPESKEKLYRTGDRVRLADDLKIIFIGRIDTQVKHRGFRIELGEIEALVSSHPHVQAAAVVLANANTDTARLEAFVVTQPDAPHDASAINALAAERLPAYMRPEHIFFINAEEMPRLPSGKINAKALHDLSVKKLAEEQVKKRPASVASSQRTAVDPSSVLGLLLSTMATVFPSAGQIKPDADFFTDLGGHSLLAAILVSRLRQITTSDSSAPFASIGLPDIYEARTAEKIALRYDDGSDSGTLNNADLDAEDGTGPRTGQYLPVSNAKFILTGIAQIIPLLFFMFIYSIEVLIPYLLFDYLTVHFNPGWAILATYGLFVLYPLLCAFLAIAGKWIFLGRVKEGEYPLYGVFYFRWWLALRFSALSNPKLMADSPIYPVFLRIMGAKVGRNCHLGALAMGPCADLLEIGDDVVVGGDVCLNTCVVERGYLVLKKVKIGSDAMVGCSSVVEGGAELSDGAEIAPLTMVPDGVVVPAFQRFHGSPARFESEVKEGKAALGKSTRPSAARYGAMAVGHSLIGIFALPLLYFLPQIPGLLLFDYLDLRDIGGWGQVAVLSIPIAIGYLCLCTLQLVVARKLVLSKVAEGTYSIHSLWFLRKWFVDRAMDLALDTLRPVFATVYVGPFLRLLGCKIGRRAEVSTARGLQFDLLDIGEESFIADMVLMGSPDVRGNQITLKKTVLEKRSFAGNASLLPSGTTLATGTLVGVLSIAPPNDRPLAPNTSCFGSPPVLMPSRHRAAGGQERLLYNPTLGRILARGFVEGCRIVIPRALLIFGLGFALQISYLGYAGIGAPLTLIMLPLFYFFLIALPALASVVLLKWVLIGVYKPAEWPIWSLKVWLSELVTATWESITEPLLASLLTGTPYLAWVFRVLGVKVGSRVTLLSSDITEYDLVSIGDEAVLNSPAGPQTHTFEDFRMQTGYVHIGARCTLKPYSIALPGSSLSEGAQLGSLSLLMKGENLPRETAWEGAPTVPRANRPRRRVAVAGVLRSPLPLTTKSSQSSTKDVSTTTTTTTTSNSSIRSTSPARA